MKPKHRKKTLLWIIKNKRCPKNCMYPGLYKEKTSSRYKDMWSTQICTLLDKKCACPAQDWAEHSKKVVETFVAVYGTEELFECLL